MISTSGLSRSSRLSRLSAGPREPVVSARARRLRAVGDAVLDRGKACGSRGREVGVPESTGFGQARALRLSLRLLLLALARTALRREPGELRGLIRGERPAEGHGDLRRR